MALETGTYISDLVAANPPNSDQKAQGAGHLRLLKSTIKATFPNVTGAVTPTHTLLNTVGVTQAVTDDSTNTATTAFVQDVVAATAFTNALPAQAGNSGKFVTTNGSVASWDAISQVPSQTTHSGKFLTTNGTAASWSTVVQGSLVLIATLTPTAAASVDALTTFSASYDNYLIVGNGLKPNVSDQLRLRVAVAGASDTGSNYIANSPESGTAVTSTTTGINITSSVYDAGKGANFEFLIQNVNSTTLIKSIAGKAVAQSTATPGIVLNGYHGTHTPNNALTGVQFYWSGGNNFTANGSIRIYGLTNS